jgi:undecaprenyl-diphosphatase
VRKGAILVLIVALGRFVVELQKYQFDRERPDPHGHLVAVHNMAFPSGHSSNAMMAWLAIALLAAPARYRVPAILIALLLAALTGLSRLVLAVHWPSDVAGGWAFGAAWVLLLASFAERAPPSIIELGKESDMANKERRDDSALIDEMEDAPSHGGSSGGNLQRDVATQAEEEHEIGGAAGVTRVTGEDKAADGDLPTLPQRD